MIKYFNIINSNEKEGLYVTILSYEMTHFYWDELVSAIKAYNKPNSPVYFDYMYRNGLSNRFFKSSTDADCLCSCNLQSYMVSSEDKYVFDKVFADNLKYVETSALTQIQKRLYKKKVLNLL